MKTLNHVVLVLVLASFGFASFGCGDDSSSPVAPSSTPMAAAPMAPAYAPAAAPSVRPASSSPDVDTVAPGDARYGPNAYDFFAHMDSGMLHVALVEDAMSTMRTASQPHRMRQVEVYHVISEPRHVLQTHGDPLYTGTVRLSGRLELPPIAVESCAPHEWIVVQAAELSDDRYDGWRNAPCPQPGGAVVGSDGSGPGWERSEHGPPPRNFPPGAPEITNPGNKRYQQGAKIEAFRIVVTGGDDVTVEVSGLPPGLVWSPDSGRVSGTVATNAEERAYRVKVTASDGTASRSLTFTITIGTTGGGGSNRAPKISDQIDRRFSPGDRVQFTIEVTDHEGDPLTVDVSGLPSWLMWEPDPGRVRGIVPAEAEERAYPVRVTANDGTNDDVTARFTITIGARGENRPPKISDQMNRQFSRGDDVQFTVVVTDEDEGDTVTVTVTGLPQGLMWEPGDPGRVRGTVSAEALEGVYPVRVTATDGTDDAEPVMFRITIGTGTVDDENRDPVIRDLDDRRYEQGQDIEPFTITATDPDGDAVTVTVTGLPDGLTWSSETGRVSGTVRANPAEYRVQVTAIDDRPVPFVDVEEFTITVVRNRPPGIGNPGDWSYWPVVPINPLRMTVADPDGDAVTVRVDGLPLNLMWTWSPQRGGGEIRVSGAVAADAPLGRTYPVTMWASDGTDEAEETFRITIIRRPAITPLANKEYSQGEEIDPFPIRVTSDVRWVGEVSLSRSLPSGLMLTSAPGGVQVSGTVAANARVGTYRFTVSATSALPVTFTITITAGSQPPPPPPPPPPNRVPEILRSAGLSRLGGSYTNRVRIRDIEIPVTDPDGDIIRLDISGLEETGLGWRYAGTSTTLVVGDRGGERTSRWVVYGTPNVRFGQNQVYLSFPLVLTATDGRGGIHELERRMRICNPRFITCVPLASP